MTGYIVGAFITGAVLGVIGTYAYIAIRILTGPNL